MNAMPNRTETFTDWRQQLPVLSAGRHTVRQLRLSDAATLLAMLATEEVSRFISPPPTTVEGFERFIAWTLKEQASGAYACFAVVPEGYDCAVGLIQVRALDSRFTIAEWGFAIGVPFWGTGLFQEAAEAVVDFAIDTLGVHRLEARAAAVNARGNGALRKLGASPEAVLRKSFKRDGVYHDQVLWAIIDIEWSQRHTAVEAVTVSIH